MKLEEYNEILTELEAIDNRLGWRDDKGLLNPSEKPLLTLVQIARPFLKTLADIALSLENISYRVT